MLLELMPRVLTVARAILLDRQPAQLSLSQFRVLFFVEHHSGAGLSAAADFLGLTLPSASKLVEHLVRRDLLLRENDAVDRRRLTLRLTREGESLVQKTHADVRARLAATLAALPDPDLEVVRKALLLLQERFPAIGGADFHRANRPPAAVGLPADSDMRPTP